MLDMLTVPLMMVGPVVPTWPLLTVSLVLGAGVSVTRAAIGVLQVRRRGLWDANFAAWMLELVLGRLYTVLRPSIAIC
jgi:hypothetical protein